jgi:protein farnesyltransferase/geranylgeranyltransferase type-1 subunit alpha
MADLVFTSRHYRQGISKRASSAERELQFINAMIDNDSKNYHAWSYRQSVIKDSGLWDWELEDTARLIKQDVRNNSAWNQRYFVLSNRPSGWLLEDIDREVAFTMMWIELEPLNESSWNYLFGYL